MRLSTGSPVFAQLLAALFLLAHAVTAFYVPFAEDYYIVEYAASPEKRSISLPRYDKREFTADDLSLRFGKRSNPPAFNPADLSLRFGRRR